MKIKTSELTGAALDWAVAKCEGEEFEIKDGALVIGTRYESNSVDDDYGCEFDIEYRPSQDWAQGGPIIEREGIDLYCNVPTNTAHADPAWRGSWRAKYHRCGFGTEMSYGPTPLIAACRCLVASKLGDEVEVPDELA